MTLIPVTLFADFTCPYSYVTEGALRLLSEPEIEILPRAFELFPTPGAVDPITIMSDEMERLSPFAEEAGLPLSAPDVRPRTRKAHEAARFARERGMEAEMRRAIYTAYWSEGLDIGRIDVLARMARELGMDDEELRIVLDIDRFEPEILHDEETARRLNVPGTPTMFIGTGRNARVVAGAQRPSDLRRHIEEWLSDPGRADPADG